MSAPGPCNCLLRAAALLGLAGVALGAFGAHSLSATLDARPLAHGEWDKAVLYQLVHAVVLLFVSREAAPRWVGGALFWGVILFSGSLYLLAVGVPAAWIWPLTPLGGLGFLAGWLGLFLYAVRKRA